jgi:phosphoribosylaminoimidazole carboxylase (NCAIR synthetase)
MKISSDADFERAERFSVAPPHAGAVGGFLLRVVRHRHPDRDGRDQGVSLAENIHQRQILDLSIVPAGWSPAIAREAVQLATAGGQTGGGGFLAAEMFLTPGGELLVNELRLGR